MAAQTTHFFLGEGGGNKTCTKVLSRCQKFACVADTIFSKKKKIATQNHVYGKQLESQ